MKSVTRLLSILGIALTFGAIATSAHAQDFAHDANFPTQHFIDARTVVTSHHLNRMMAPSAIDVVVNFETASSKLTPAAEKQVHHLAMAIKAHPGHYVVKGYTDDKGSSASNLKLSYKRALTVMHTLTKVYGIPAGTLSAEGQGAADPVATNSTAEGRAANRRVSVSCL
jgi:outer membrane protein OmpA-like peptidoglycan-associated protein